MGSAPKHDWFIRDWLAATGKTQTDLQRLAGWSKRKASDVMNGGRYNRDIINDVAFALSVQPYELLLHPSEAMEVRQVRSSIQLAAERRREYTPSPATEVVHKNGTNGG